MLKNCFYYVQLDYTPGILIRKHIIANTLLRRSVRVNYISVFAIHPENPDWTEKPVLRTACNSNFSIRLEWLELIFLFLTENKFLTKKFLRVYGFPRYFSLKNTKQTKLYEMKRVFRKNLKMTLLKTTKASVRCAYKLIFFAKNKKLFIIVFELKTLRNTIILNRPETLRIYHTHEILIRTAFYYCNYNHTGCVYGINILLVFSFLMCNTLSCIF